MGRAPRAPSNAALPPTPIRVVAHASAASVASAASQPSTGRALRAIRALSPRLETPASGPPGPNLRNYDRASQIKLEALVRRGLFHSGDIWSYHKDLPGYGRVQYSARIVSIHSVTLTFETVNGPPDTVVVKNPKDFVKKVNCTMPPQLHLLLTFDTSRHLELQGLDGRHQEGSGRTHNFKVLMGKSGA